MQYSIVYYATFFGLLISAAAINPELCSKGCLACNLTQLSCTACADGFELNVLGKCLPTNGS
jgi:hypothetical protein